MTFLTPIQNEALNNTVDETPAKTSVEDKTAPVSLGSKAKATLKTTVKKILEFAANAFLVCAGLFLYWTNPALFAIGMVVGFVFDDKVKEVVEKIKCVWEARSFGMAAVAIIAGYLSLPIILAAGSFLTGSYIGDQIHMKAKAAQLAKSN
jgi:uncharacterized membrane protein